MSDRAKELIRHTEDLIASIKELRGALLDYQKGCERLLKAGESGASRRSTVETVDLFKFAEKRQRVAEALTEFETARRRGWRPGAGVNGSGRRLRLHTTRRL